MILFTASTLSEFLVQPLVLVAIALCALGFALVLLSAKIARVFSNDANVDSSSTSTRVIKAIALLLIIAGLVMIIISVVGQ